jgi:2-keto-4-pentenoate hydratase
MMNQAAIDRAADILIEARRSNRKCGVLPADARPTTEEEGFAVQAAVAVRLGSPIGGWKVGLAPGAPPSFAPIFAADVIPSPVAVPPGVWSLRGVEGEIAFRLGRDLPRRAEPYSRAEVEAAIASAHAVIEIVDSRYADAAGATYPEKLADSVSNGALVVGPAVTAWKDLDLTQVPVHLTIGGKVLTDKTGGVPGGDPVAALLWLANHLRTSPLAHAADGLAAGQMVTTGSCTGLPFAAAGDEAVASFAGLGTVTVAFAG